MTIVLPVPAPPNTADFPPLRNGQIRSMTFIPVSKISAVVAWSAKDGGGRWIGSRRSPFTAPLPSIGSPTTLKSRPSVSFPTGTVIGPPVFVTFMPRRRPSVDCIATARTQLFPRCCCTSAVTTSPLLSSRFTVRA